ncbi:hypothetical protein OH76DRAFT_1402057 [Lentinus brumalis]|uniref:BTB domain-containing protein n=1 Tax=Lentinus brumalis TaxID=2498619 RepID=A0A371DEA6_9APHY|nr:hypothetical protein OH76DRAFT_1402057 [Polyporus brumalis]
MNRTAGLPRDTEVSFPDGNAIIIAGNTLFRVYNGMLARHCPALAAQVNASAEFISGCPVVRITDTPHDIKQILRVDNPTRPPADSQPFSVLAAWVRIGTKYDMGKLVDHAIGQLQSLFPACLPEWDDRGNPESRHGFAGANAIEALNLFQATKRFEMVPAAVYRCCQLAPAVVRNGTTRADGTRERLSRKNIDLVARAKERSKEHGARMIEECEEQLEQAESCSYSWGFPDGCAEVISHLGYTEENGKEAWRDGDPLNSRFLHYVDEQEDGKDYQSRDDFANCMGACSNCIEEVHEQLGVMRAVVWNDLPAMAGVDQEIGYWCRGVCDD